MNIMAKNEIEIYGTMKLAFVTSFLSGLVLGFLYALITGKWIEAFFILLSCIITGIVIKIALDISIKRLVGKLAGEMDIIKQGDFSRLVDSKGYGLLGGLSSAINGVLSDIRALIEGFFTLSMSIIQSSRKVGTTASQAAVSINEISKTVDEIAKGASEQAQEAQQGVQLIEKLSEQINFVYKSYNEVMDETTKINSLNNIGLDSVNTLRGKSEENYNMSEKIFAVVEKLTNTTNNISLFVESIENIAEQTNLLALNAAIEAARAGEAGRGFAVVAEEVRTLADQSRKSTEEINNLMESISEESQMAIHAMETMKQVSQEQNKAVNKTNSAFSDIANAIVSIVEKIREVNVAVSRMEQDKDEVISAIENISSVSQQTAASSEEVAATTDAQLKTIDDMKIASQSLGELVSELDKKLKKYKLR
jgi:methyl-accepting chemotaxis protein